MRFVRSPATWVVLVAALQSCDLAAAIQHGLGANVRALARRSLDRRALMISKEDAESNARLVAALFGSLKHDSVNFLRAMV